MSALWTYDIKWAPYDILDMTGCTVFSMHWIGKITIFCPIQKWRTRWDIEWHFRSLMCEKDINTLLILVIENNPRKFVLSWVTNATIRISTFVFISSNLLLIISYIIYSVDCCISRISLEENLLRSMTC